MGGIIDKCGEPSALILYQVHSVRISGISREPGQCGVSPFRKIGSRPMGDKSNAEDDPSSSQPSHNFCIHFFVAERQLNPL